MLPSATALTHSQLRSLTEYNWHSTVIKSLFRGDCFLWVIISLLDNWLSDSAVTDISHSCKHDEDITSRLVGEIFRSHTDDKF